MYDLYTSILRRYGRDIPVLTPWHWESAGKARQDETRRDNNFEIWRWFDLAAEAGVLYHSQMAIIVDDGGYSFALFRTLDSNGSLSSFTSPGSDRAINEAA